MEYKNDLRDATWSVLPGNVPGTGAVATKTDFEAAGLPKRFYRVVEM